MNPIISNFGAVISSKRSSKKLIFNGLFTLISASIIIFAGTLISDHTSAAYISLFSVGCAGVLFFGIKLILGGSRSVYLPTGSRIKECSVYIKSDAMDKLIGSIAASDVNTLMHLASGSPSSIRLDVIVSNDCQFAACQAYKYIPHNFEAASEIYRIDESKIEDFYLGIKHMLSK